jgi:arsenite methyltransferase
VQASCCGDSPRPKSVTGPADQVYDAPEVAELPEEVTGTSLGCGDPVTLASLEPGQTVLDLGSGGGLDCFIAARQVGESGHVIGVDMTAEMINLARRNREKVGLANVEFRLGEIEHIPAADDSVDVIISNCVVNLSPDKPQVFREAFRTLKPGGLLAVSDLISEGPMPEAFLKNMRAWGACVSGALSEKTYIDAIEAAGFVDVKIEREYPDREGLDEELIEAGYGDDLEDIRQGKKLTVKSEEGVQVISLDDLNLDSPPPRIFSGKVKARKPLTG